MNKPANQNAKSTATSSSQSPTNTLATSIAATTHPAGERAPAAPLPTTWSEIAVGNLVIAHEGPEDGWWEAVVTEVRGDMLTLRWRDFPKLPTIVRDRKAVALLSPNE